MKLRKLLYLFLSIVITFAAFDAADSYAASRTKSKARTSQSSKGKSSKKRSSKGKSSKSRSGKKKSSRYKKSGSRKSSGTRKKRRNVARTTYKETPRETPQNDSLTGSRWLPSATTRTSPTCRSRAR